MSSGPRGPILLVSQFRSFPMLSRDFEMNIVLLHFRGSFGVLHRAIEKATGRNWGALFMKARPVDREFVKREVELMNDLHHHKLLQLHEAYEQPGEMILIREL